MYNNFFANELDYEIYINTKFSTTFDLSYTLIDLQSIINGFTCLTKTEGLYSHKVLDRLNKIEEEAQKHYKLPYPYTDDYFAVARRVASRSSTNIRQYKNDELSNIISHVLDNNSSDINESTRNILAKDLETSVKLYLSDTLSQRAFPKERESYIQTTNRAFAKKYSHLLKLKSFKSGSLFLDIASSVISGLIVEFIKKIVAADSGKSEIFQVNYTCNNIQIQINDPYIKNDLVKKHISVNEKTLSKSYDLNLETYFNELFSQIQITPFNYEDNVTKFIAVLVENNIITYNCLYDEKGIKTMSRDLRRFSGMLLDTYV